MLYGTKQHTPANYHLVTHRVQARSRGGRSAGLSEKVRLSFADPGEVKGREVVLDPQESPEEIKSREAELGSESWTSFASVVPQQLCNGHCHCDCSAQQLKQQLRSTLVAYFLFWRWSTASSVFPGRCARSSHSLFIPPPFPCP